MAMQITPEAKRKIQLFLLAVIALAAVRAGYILYQRHAESIEQKKKQAAPPLNPDYYVTPKKLDKHWPADVWQAIEKHEVKPGMNELQADFAIGMGIPQQQSDPAVKTVNYPNGGNPLTITYRNGKAAEISPGPKQ